MRRYTKVTNPITDGPLEVHWRRMDWDEVYRDWPADHPLRYYWRRKNGTTFQPGALKVVPFDPDANPGAAVGSPRQLSRRTSKSD